MQNIVRKWEKDKFIIQRPLKNMKKIIALTSLAFSAFMLAACDSMDNPSPLDTRPGASGNELNPGGLPSDAAMNADSGLQERGINGMNGFDPENINPEDIVVTVYFGFDQYAGAPSERANVQKAANFFADNPDFKIVLVGHTDWYGTEEYNMLLSDKRAKAVSDYMSGLGIGPERVEIIARGEAGAAMDVAKNSAEARHDRRVEIVKVR